MTRLAVVLATAGGVGRAPVAPGTFGSAVGVAIYLATRSVSPLGQVALVVILSGVGVWAAAVAARHFGRDDPGPVVIDEVAGQLLTLLLTGVGLTGAVVGFFLFRVLDIIKPWPAGRLEALPGGWGIMADDLMAAVYGNLVIQMAVRLLPGWL